MSLQETVNHAKDLLRTSMSNTLKFIVPRIKPEREIFNDLIQAEGRYNHIENEFNNGLIESHEKDLIINQIRSSILHTLNRLTETDLKLPNQNESISKDDNSGILLERLRESIAEIEKLKAERQYLKTEDRKHKLKIIIKCEPEMDDRPSNYSCQCIIWDDETGESKEKEIPLRKEPGGIVATIHDINPKDYVQIRIKDNEKEWESDCFSPQFLTQILRLI